MAIEGPLKELGIHDVFQLLDLSRKTGELTVTSPLRHNRGTIYFDAGALVYAEIESNPHPLGGLLLRAGKITEADLERARGMQQVGDRRRLGEILVVIGAITRRELERQVRFQVEEVVFEVMNWREGYFSFVEGPLQDVSAEATVRVATESVLMEGARRIDEWSRIERKIPHLGVVPTLAPADAGGAGKLDLLPSDWELLAVIDGERSVRELAGLLGRSEFDVAKTVFGLESAGLIVIADQGRGPAPAPPGAEDLSDLLARADEALRQRDAEGARGWVESARARHPNEPAVYVTLGRVHLTASRPAQAEEELRRALRLDPLRSPAHRLLGDALALQGRLGEAVEWWERWLKLGAENGGDDGEARAVREAAEAARGLDAFLRRSHG